MSVLFVTLDIFLVVARDSSPVFLLWTKIFYHCILSFSSTRYTLTNDKVKPPDFPTSSTRNKVRIHTHIHLHQHINSNSNNFSNDVLFLGELSVRNVMNLLKCLKWYEATSSLTINLNKSFLYGVGVSSEMVASLASSLSCSAGKLSFIYLGLPVGANMKPVASWGVIE